MNFPILAILLAFSVLVLLFLLELRRKNVFIWLPSYIKQSLRKKEKYTGPLHIIFCFVDHFEPGWQQPGLEVERARVARWCKEYPLIADRHRDADGHVPKHCFFYPAEEYREEHLDKLSDLCARGYGEIEVHLHHDNDTEEALREKLTDFISKLADIHDALPHDRKGGTARFAFIHGNWSLNNSRRDGRWCGVNNELAVLQDLGCYADFTLPSAPSDTQTSKINSIYYASGDPRSPKSHDNGVDVEACKPDHEDVVLIQGPLALDWRRRKFGIFPRIENADVRKSLPPTPDRIDLWILSHIHVKGRPEWCFVKIHTHGTQEADMNSLLGSAFNDMYTYLEQQYNDGQHYLLHYVTAREMYNIIKAAEDGLHGNPHSYRDYLVAAPQYIRQSVQSA